MSKKTVLHRGVVVAAVLGLLTYLASGDPRSPTPGYTGPVAPFKQAIGPVAVKVLPARGIVNAATFAAGTVYTQGAIVKAGRHLYMCVYTNSAGTAGTNTPYWVTGEGSDGTNVWRAFPAGQRKGWLLYNAGTNDLRLGYGYVPTATTGGVITPGGNSSPISDLLQDAVYLIGVGATTNGLVTGVEL